MPPDTWEDVCIDSDGDGHGFQCAAGDDCDDSDASIFEGCLACAKPNEGCECAADTAPVDCELPKTLTASGSLLCKTGTRYCRDGVWSGCEGIKSFEAPPPSRLLASAAVDSDAAQTCGECDPDCYVVDDPLTPNSDAGSSIGSNLVPGDNGGITLGSYILDGGNDGSSADAALLDDIDCSPGTAPDFECDGIPDEFDPYPEDPPFDSDHSTIFMDLGPGEQQSQTFEIEFYLNTADIYLYLDMTGSMGGELTNLISSLRNNNYLSAAENAKPCRDRNRNKDTSDEEYLKNEGITGNIACLIRDSSFGAGWHRDLPFPKPDSSGFAYGPHDFELFQHEQDITDDVELVLAALNRFHTRGGINRPEGGIMGLYALATGSELYTGWNRPGNPARTCDTGYWGYACFRDDAVPIVIWMTDAPVTNGPAPAEGHLGPERNSSGSYVNQPLYWGASSLGIERGTGNTYYPVSGNDTLANAFVLENVNTSFKTYTGNTRGLASNITYADIGGFCQSGNGWSGGEQGAPDVFFRMSVTQNETLTISTRGSRFETALAIYPVSGAGGNVTSREPATADTTPASPYSLGTVSINPPTFASGPAPKSALFSRDAIGCLATDDGSSDLVAGSVLKFNLASNAATLRVMVDTVEPAATALFAGRPMTPTDTNMTTIAAPYGTGTRTGNSNDYFGSFNVGDMTGQYRRFVNATTNDSDLTIPDVPASFFQNASAACSGVSSSSSARDAVYDFSLSAPTTLRIEGAGNNDTLTASFDHVIALVKRTTNTHAASSGNTSDATAVDIPASELPNDPYTWTQYIGTLASNSGTTYTQSEVGTYQSSPSSTDCTNAAPSNSAYQAVYSFTPTTTASYDFNTSGSNTSNSSTSGTGTWISIHEYVADTQRTPASTNPNTGNATASNSQDLGVLDSASIFVQSANINTGLSSGTTNGEVNNNTMASGCSSSLGGRDALYRFTLSSIPAGGRAISVTLGSSTGTVWTPSAPGFNATMAVYYNGIGLANRLAGSCTDIASGNNGGTLSFTATAAGTYYVLVKALSTGSQTNGTYGLWLRDTTTNYSYSTRFKGCDYGSANYAASITRTLTANRKYYIVIKGSVNGMAYKLNARRTPASEPAALACDRNGSGTAQHSYIQQLLQPGDYSVIIRGYGSSNNSYNLLMRDMAAAPAPVSCMYDGSRGTAPYTFTNLAARDASNNPIDYYLVVRGNTAPSAYAFQFDTGSSSATGVRCAADNVTMGYASGSAYNQDINNAEWTGTLPLGDYYIVLKGIDQTDEPTDTEDDDSGMYQLTVGDKANYETTGTFADKRWLGPTGNGAGGVLEALKERKIHVITVDSTDGSSDDDRYSDQQLSTIATATGAVRSDGTPIFFNIWNDGSGLGSAIVTAVSDLAENLAMDVGVQLVEEPQSPAPKHFRFTVRAIDQVGDGCDPPTEDRDGDALHIPDTHVACYPGAEPRFEITFSNPTPPNHVEPNPLDPKGGYNMKLRLIGRDGTLNADGTPKTYNIDEIPVYIIPEDVVPEPGEERFNESGTYEQVLSSAKCFDNESPVWGMLSWVGTLDSGTSVTWKVCTAETEALLASCTPQTVATFRSGIDCTSDSQCENGYCPSDTHKCEFATGVSCSASADCAGGTCVSGACMYGSRSVDVKPALARGLQGKRFARVQATLQANAAHTRAPTVSSWNLRYTCSAQE